MNDTFVVSGFNGLGRHQRDAPNFRRRYWTLVDQLGQSGAFNVFEHQVPETRLAGANVVKSRDVRMIESRNCPAPSPI